MKARFDLSVHLIALLSLPRARAAKPSALALGVAAVLALAGCGGGSGGAAAESAAPDAGTAMFTVEAAALPADAADAEALPTYHLAPDLLPEPADADAVDNTASARTAPHVQSMSGDAQSLDTQRLTVQAMRQHERARAQAASRAHADGAGGSLAPAAAAASVVTYTPAQIRAAYALPALTAAGVAPTPLQAAQQGAGQTIYIVDARHDPMVATELAAFNTKFGLPACPTRAIAAASALPLPAANAADGCTLSVVYSTAAGTMTTTAPAYDAGWATEIALDVQWAHATAPRARIVLIEAPDASLNSLLAAVRLANAMGPGVVSMSFGGAEGDWTSQVDASFAAAGMSYLAATGDSGSGVSWPAVSSNVLAVGGTSLTWSGAGARSEAAWSKGGGGISAYTALPSYQSNAVPGLGTPGRRAVADVSFNADPRTGQYVAVMTPGTTSASWVSAGGTSLSTPQWAGLLAVSNALRAQAAQAPIGAPHAALYTQIARVPGNYAAAFADVVSGSDGNCATCAAHSGYDIPTGLGTPNAGALLVALGASASVPAAVAPAVASATVNGKAGVALSYAVATSGGPASSFSIANAPAGMTISNTGTLSWPKPVAGSYAVTVTAANAATGLSGKGVVSVVIAAGTPPVITAPSLTGVAGKPISGTISVASSSAGLVTVQVGGVPAGVQFTVGGASLMLAWRSPVAGKYTLSVTAKDAAGLVATSSFTITVSAK